MQCLSSISRGPQVVTCQFLVLVCFTVLTFQLVTQATMPRHSKTTRSTSHFKTRNAATFKRSRSMPTEATFHTTTQTKSKTSSRCKTKEKLADKRKSTKVKKPPGKQGFVKKADHQRSKQSYFQKHRWSIIASVGVIGTLAIATGFWAAHGSRNHMDMIDKSVDPCDDFYQRACGKIRRQKLIEKGVDDYFSYAETPSQHINDFLESAMNSHYSGKSNMVRYYLELLRQCTSSSQPSLQETLTEEAASMVGEKEFPVKSGGNEINDNWMEAYVKFVLMTGNGPIFYVEFINNEEVKGGMKWQISYSGLKKPAANSTEFNKFLRLFEQSEISELEQFESNFNSYKSKPNDNNNQEILLMKIEDLKVKSNINFFKFFQTFLKVTHNPTNRIKPSTIIYVANLDFFTVFAKALKETPTRVLKNYFGYRLAAKLILQFIDVDKGNKQDGEKPPFNICAEAIFNFGAPNNESTIFTLALNRIYVDYYIAAHGKAKLDLVQKQTQELVNDLREAMGTILKGTAWIDETTKKAALKKLKAMQQIVTYETWLLEDAQIDEVMSFTDELKVIEGNYIRSAIKFSRHAMTMQLRPVDGRNDPKFYSPAEHRFVNAYYKVDDNGIVIPLGYLQPPLFEVDTPAAINFGSVGSIIGHEITHGYDSSGREYNAQGLRHNWWNTEAEKKFEEKAMCFVKQYSAIVEPKTGLNLNGNLTLGEDIADNGGLKAAYTAFQKRRGKSSRAAVVKGEYDGYNDVELFFYSYAHNYCGIEQNASSIASLIIEDEHTLNNYRVNVVLSNFAPFAKAFNCANGTKMNPVKKCAVW